jgi:hypothetical protein
MAASAAGLKRLGHVRGPRKLTVVVPTVPVARTPGTDALMTMQRRPTSLRRCGAAAGTEAPVRATQSLASLYSTLGSPFKRPGNVRTLTASGLM